MKISKIRFKRQKSGRNLLDMANLFFKNVCFCVMFAAMSIGMQGKVHAQYPPKTEIPNAANVLESLEGKVVDLWLSDGNAVGNLKVLSVKKHRTNGLPTSIRVMQLQSKEQTAKGGKKKRKSKARWVSSKKISEIYIENAPLDVKYDKKTRTLFHSESKRVERLKHQRETAIRLSKKRKKYWSNLSEKEQKAYKDKLDAFLENAKKNLTGVELESRETEFFILATDLPPAQANYYLVQLDAMYQRLSKAFGLCPDKNLWCGKCLAFIFKNRATFHEFESRFHEFEKGFRPNRNPPNGAVGLCHQLGDGRVIFAGYQGGRSDFANTVVHETTHGFVFRYKSNVLLPNWLNEGISDWASGQIAGKKRILIKQRSAVRHVLEGGLTWGSSFLTADNIADWQYGVASAVVDILLKNQKKDEFRRFVDLIKEGHDPEEALKETYKIDFKELEAAYVLKATGRRMPQQEQQGQAASGARNSGGRK